MSRYKGDNSGGYGNPPIDHQFKLGGPGGPGRPKGRTNMDAALSKVFGGKVTYKENGQPMEGPATEALGKRALQLGLSGNQRANAAAMELARKYGPQDSDEPDQLIVDLSEFTDEELRLVGKIMAKLTGDQAWDPPRDDSLPLVYRSNPDDPRNYITERTIDGLHYRRALNPEFGDELLRIENHAYFSAALPRRAGCYRRD